MKKFTSITQQKGEFGERYAEKYLKNKGYSIFDKNFTRKFGEIDIVTIKDMHVDYFEVKSMRQMSLINARENLTPSKIKKLVRICNFHFLSIMKPAGFVSWSLHALLIVIDPSLKRVEVELVKNINI